MKTSRLIFFFILNISLFIVAPPAWANLTIEQAYRAIPHRQTVFDGNTAKMPKEEKAFLKAFFHLIDLAMVERVDMLIWLSSNGRNGAVANNYDEILSQLNRLNVSKKMKNAHYLVVAAINEQKEVLFHWKKNGFKGAHALRSDPLVRSASQKLIQAYGILMKLYPNENQHNKQAFFDYLCALDFL